MTVRLCLMGTYNPQGRVIALFIYDKIHRFSDKTRHQIFVEPEGWNTIEVYVNGFSTSLPDDVQYAALRLVPGFEDVVFPPGLCH